MLRKIIIAAAAMSVLGIGAAIADDINGNWRTEAGETAAITGNGPFTVTLKTGKHAGKRIGTMNAQGDGKYTGKITDPADDKTYSGKATLTGNSLKMSGCVFGGLICRGENWQRM